MRSMGANVLFMNCVWLWNGEFKITLKRSDTENGHVREMSYENFFQQYGKTIDLFSPKEKKPEQSKQSSKLAIAKFFGIGKEDKDDDGSNNDQDGDDDSLSSMVLKKNQKRMVVIKIEWIHYWWDLNYRYLNNVKLCVMYDMLCVLVHLQL